MFNRYAYVGNDPVNATDPTGEFLQILAGAVGGAIISAGVNVVQQVATGKGSIGDRIKAVNVNQVAISAAGGAAIGATLAATGNPVIAAAAGGAVTGAVTLGSDIESGAFKGNLGGSLAKAAVATGIGAITTPLGAGLGQALSKGVADDIAYGVLAEAGTVVAVQVAGDQITGGAGSLEQQSPEQQSPPPCGQSSETCSP